MLKKISQSDVKELKKLHKTFKLYDYNYKKLFSLESSKKNYFLVLTFFLATMSIEVLLNQPFKNKIKIIHNNISRRFFKSNFEKVDRIETNSFGFSLLIILRRLIKENREYTSYLKEFYELASLHWLIIQNYNSDECDYKINQLKNLWKVKNNIILKVDQDSLIDLIIDLYKSFEIGIGNKAIIKRNIASLIYSVSKANKEFRSDVLKEFKKRIK